MSATVGLGVLGCIVFGTLASKSNDITILGKYCAMFSLIFLTLFGVLLFLMEHTNWGWIGPMIMLGLTAFFGMPMLPLVMELGVEVLFPLSESVVGALLWLSGNANTLFVVLVAGQLDIPRLGIYRRAPTFAFFWCVNATGLFCMIRLRVRVGLRRKHYEDGRIGSEPVHRLRAPLLHTCRLNSC